MVTQIFTSKPNSLLPKSNLLNLPAHVLQRILLHLLVSPSRLLLHRDASTPSNYRASVATSVLFVNHQLYHTSLPILYGSNTFTSSSPATSYDFDVHLSRVPGKNKCLVRHIDLEIDWGSQLWMKFPLIAMRLGELRGLRNLQLCIVDGKDLDTGFQIQGEPKGTRSKREGHVAVMMLNTEKKILEEMVKGLKALRVFKLKGFEDAEFARRLEVGKASNSNVELDKAQFAQGRHVQHDFIDVAAWHVLKDLPSHTSNMLIPSGFRNFTPRSDRFHSYWNILSTMPRLKRVREDMSTKESPPRKVTRRDTSLKDTTTKGTPTKGTPIKGTPTKGTPTKGTPKKTLIPKATTAPNEREIIYFVSSSDLKLTITLYTLLPITYGALSYCLAGAYERANRNVKDDLTPNEPMYYPIFEAQSASNDTEPASHDTETASNDTEPASHDTETASNDTETASNDTETASNDTETASNDTEPDSHDTEIASNNTEPASNDTEPPLQFGIVGDIRWGKNQL
ncbi:MAG: hypothetical protein Q9226_002169, partial [Calogaya cf. arnoldii]